MLQVPTVNNLSKHFARLTKEEEDEYLMDILFAQINGYDFVVPQMSLMQALVMFPEAKPIVLRKLKQERAERLNENADWQKLHLENPPQTKAHREHYEAHRDILEQEIDNLQKKIRSLTYRVEKDTGGGITAEMVARAKAYPIGNLLSVGGDNKTKCLFHNENHGSMHWYKESNRFKCFGCQKGGDAIDVCMKLRDIDFTSAVKLLQ